jgi:hypothetical protein
MEFLKAARLKTFDDTPHKFTKKRHGKELFEDAKAGLCKAG